LKGEQSFPESLNKAETRVRQSHDTNTIDFSVECFCPILFKKKGALAAELSVQLLTWSPGRIVNYKEFNRRKCLASILGQSVYDLVVDRVAL
jgi:hypothetical protein